MDWVYHLSCISVCCISDCGSLSLNAWATHRVNHFDWVRFSRDSADFLPPPRPGGKAVLEFMAIYARSHIDLMRRFRDALDHEQLKLQCHASYGALADVIVEANMNVG